jgi:peroxiredoxin
MTKPMPGAQAPALKLATVGGGTFDLAAEKPATFTMLVFYRGLHCGVCKGFLPQVAKAVAEFEKVGTKVVAISMDPQDRAEKAAAEWGLDGLTLAYGLSEETAREFGLYISQSIKEAETATFSEPGLFLVDNEGKFYLINISSMPFARPDISDLPAKIAFATQNGYPARGTKG